MASPLEVENELAAEAETLEKLQVTLDTCALEIVKQLAAAGNHLEQATTCAVVLAMNSEMLCEFVDSCRQDSDLHIGAAGVFVVQFEFLGAGGSFAHVLWVKPDTLSGGLVCCFEGREGTTLALFGKDFFTSTIHRVTTPAGPTSQALPAARTATAAAFSGQSISCRS